MINRGESARKFEETVDERQGQSCLVPQVRVAASLHLMGVFLSRWALRILAFLSGLFFLSSFLYFFNGSQSSIV